MVERSRGWRRREWLAGSLAGLVWLGERAEAKERGGASPSWAVASESESAARDARTVLLRGGSAADAAIVAALVAGVTSPTSSGIGGGGFVVGWDATRKEPYVIDFREVAPAGLEREPFERRPLDIDEVGHLVGVPGEVSGLYALHQRAGKLPWAQLVAFAEKRASQGFVVGPHLASMLAWAAAKLRPVPGFDALYYPGGRPAPVGTRVTNPALAKTLGLIASQGPQGFYSGPVAEDIVETVRAHGGRMTLADLENYQVESRRPLALRHDGLDIYTMPPPSAGGLMMAQVLELFPGDVLRQVGHGTAAYEHLLAEAMRGAVADRARYIGDPAFAEFDLLGLVSPERMSQRRARIAVGRSHALPRFGIEEQGTHHLVTQDRAGNVVSLTTTINHLFGAKLHAQASGVVLNNELDDFSSRKSVAAYGMSDTPNRARPGARPVSSMTPTIGVREGTVQLALGGSGGTAIATNVTQVLLAASVFEHSAQRSVRQDRIYIPSSGNRSLLVERGTAQAHVRQLEWRGEVVGETPFPTTAVQMIKNGEQGTQAAADPRKHGAAFDR